MKTCPQCKGTKVVNGTTCPTCNGVGTVPESVFDPATVKTIDATVTAVENIGSPDSLLVTVTYPVTIQQQPRRYAATFAAHKGVHGSEKLPGDVDPALWPPQVGDKFPLSYDFGRLARGAVT